MLFDQRKIRTVPNCNHSASHRILIGLKHFDVFSQKLYFVDWIYVIKNVTKIVDIACFVETHSLCKDQYFFKKCQKYFKEMSKYEKNKKELQTHFIFYEEETPKKINNLQNTAILTDEFCHGDVLVFQLNPHHSYCNNHPIAVETILSHSQHSVHKNADSFILSLQSKH